MKKFIHQNSINYLAIFKFLLSKKKTIIILGFVGAVFGGIKAYISPKIYSSSITIIPNKASKGFGGKFNGLASLAGISLGGVDNSDIPPITYDKVLESYDFNHKLLNTKLPIVDSDTMMTFIEYQEKFKRNGIGKFIKGLIGFNNDNDSLPIDELSEIAQKNELKLYTNDEYKNLIKFQSMVNIDVDDLNDIFTIRVKFPDKIAAPYLAEKATILLQDFIINAKIKKAKADYEFLKSRYDEEKEKFLEAQLALAKFEDTHINIVSSVQNTQRTILKSEYQLRNQVFTQLSMQLESSQMTLQKDTPVFTVVKGANVPRLKTEPRPIKLVIVNGILFGFLYVVFILLKELKNQFLPKETE